MARILVIEDNLADTQLMVYLLEAFGHEPVEAVNGREGLARAQEEKFDLVLCDIQLPGMDGYEFIRLVKSDPLLKEIPFAFISSTVWLTSDPQKALSLGAIRFIQRPIEPSDLLHEVEACLKESGSADLRLESHGRYSDRRRPPC